MNNYPFFRYVPISSKIHKLNSKMKILCFLINLVSFVLIKDYISLLISVIYSLYLVYNSKVNIKAYTSNLMMIWPLYLFVMVLSYLITFNVLNSFLITLKTIIIILLFLILTFTTSLSEISWGFECLFEKLKKLKIPVTKISLKIAMIIKFISTLFDQYKQIRKSMAYKGVALTNSNISTATKMFFPLVRLSYNSSKRMVSSMKLRFYGSTKKRTNYHNNKTTKFDKLLVVLSIVLIYVTLLIGWFL